MSAETLQRLLAVQELDTAADQLRHRRSHLPEQAELANLDAEAAAVASDRDGVEEALIELGGRQKAAEGELSATEERMTAINRRLFGGEVSASRDLQAMSGELEQLKARASALEDSVLALMEEREPLEARASDLRDRSEQIAARRTATAEELAAAQAGLDRELQELTARRDQAAATVAGDLLARYEQLRTRLGGVGVARLVGNHCDGCHLTLPAVELDRVRHLGPDEIYQCEQCSRILVP